MQAKTLFESLQDSKSLPAYFFEATELAELSTNTKWMNFSISKQPDLV